MTKKVDWEAVEKDYRIGAKTLREMADIYGISHVAIKQRADKFEWSRDLSTNKDGFVYVIYIDDSAGERFFKIGMTSSFGPRFKMHQCSSPFDVSVVVAYFCENMRTEEKYLHDLFKEKNIRGEWFRLNDDDLNVIALRSNRCG
jgi:hypothetical protein